LYGKEIFLIGSSYWNLIYGNAAEKLNMIRNISNNFVVTYFEFAFILNLQYLLNLNNV